MIRTLIYMERYFLKKIIFELDFKFLSNRYSADTTPDRVLLLTQLEPVRSQLDATTLGGSDIASILCL